MEMLFFVLAMVGIPIGAITSIFLYLIRTTHQRKMAELRVQTQEQGGEAVRAEIAALRAEIHALRDTTTQYDISFDAALHRMERRVEGLETQPRISTHVAEPPNVYVGR